MEPTNTGSFGAAIGGSTALKEAMQRRGMDTSVLQQTSPGSVAGAPPTPQPVSDLSVAQAAIPEEPTMPAQPAQSQPAQPTDPELSIALEALGSFVKSGGQTRRDLAKGRVQGII